MISDHRSPRQRTLLERAPRHAFHKTLIVSSFGSMERYKANCLNISHTGYLIEGLGMPFKIGSLIELYLEIQGKKIKLAGKVARVQFIEHSEKIQYGVQLSFTDGDEYTLWKNFVSSHVQAAQSHETLPFG